MTDVLTRERHIFDPETCRKEGQLKVDQGLGRCILGWNQRRLEEARKDPPERKSWPCEQLDFVFLPPILWENRFLLFKATWCMAVC